MSYGVTRNPDQWSFAALLIMSKLFQHRSAERKTGRNASRGVAPIRQNESNRLPLIALSIVIGGLILGSTLFPGDGIEASAPKAAGTLIARVYLPLVINGGTVPTPVTSTSTPTALSTQASTSTSTLTATKTATPTVTPTQTSTPTASGTSTKTASPTVTPTLSSTPTASGTSTKTATPTVTPTQTSTPTATGTATKTATPTLTATQTSTPTATGTATKTATRTVTATQTSTPTATQTPGNLAIYSITDNRSSYPNSQIPRYEKLEITFQLTTAAQNLQMPYDPSPPSGVTAGIGVTVNALFTSPSGHVYTQPAFYYQDFDYQVKSGREWMYPNGNYSWKVRFAPNELGTWQYSLTGQDGSGTTQSAAQNFTVTDSSNHGFVKVSQKDPRYFEFIDGTYFPGLGYNMNYNAIDWSNPVLNNQNNFQTMAQNGIQLVRMWLSQWSIWGSAWNPWYGIRNDYDGYIPRTGLITYGSSDPVSAQMVLVYSEDSSGNQNSGSWFDACRFIGGFQAAPAVKENTQYHIKIRYKAYDITGPRVGSYPNFGFVAKVQNPNDGNWHTHCYNPGQPTNGVVVSAYGHDSASWTYLEGTWNSGGNDFLPIFYLVLENVNSINPADGNHPYVFIDTVSIQEDLGGGAYGPNIVTKPSMEHEKYFMDRNAYAFDKVVDLAHQDNVYLRPVVMEKNEQIENEIGYDGNKADFDNNDFYGNYRTVTAIRWYQTAWWRYLQARWGYSTNIQSWELLNEGDPWNDHHYTLADEFGKYMHQFGPDSHLVSTSNWNSFPASQFWANASYPNVDFADLHQYIPLDSDPTHFYDTARLPMMSACGMAPSKEAELANQPYAEKLD